MSAVPALNRVAFRERARRARSARNDEAESVTNRLGSGSDYTVFLNFLGVPIADLSFTGPYGVYHSIYDNHLWVEKFGDPGFARHAAMTRVWGVMALRLANADIVPLDYRATATRLREFVNEATESAPRSATARRSCRLAGRRGAIRRRSRLPRAPASTRSSPATRRIARPPLQSIAC